MVALKENLILGAVLAFIAVSAPALALLQLSGTSVSERDLILVLGGTEQDHAQVARAHQGHVVGGLNTRFGTFLTGEPSMIPELYEHGAWMVLPANTLAFLCAPNSSKDTLL